MIRDELLKIGFLTGSRAFGTNRPDSDYDIVYSVVDSPIVARIIEGRETISSDYFAGYYFRDDDGAQVNLIPVHPHEFLPWYLATRAMKETLKISGIDSTIKKYSVFMGIVSLYKGTVKEERTVNEYNKVKADILSIEAGTSIDDISAKNAKDEFDALFP
jgi:predicted nucleotidyltransferase